MAKAKRKSSMQKISKPKGPKPLPSIGGTRSPSAGIAGARRKGKKSGFGIG